MKYEWIDPNLGIGNQELVQNSGFLGVYSREAGGHIR